MASPKPAESIPVEPAPGRRVQPIVITEAQIPYDQEVAARRKKYVIMMGLRVPLLVAATWVGLTLHLVWLSLLLFALMIPLPWMAVLIANDRPARRARTVLPGTINTERALTPGPGSVVDGE